jgi:beta-glucanase (GH16 family)
VLAIGIVAVVVALGASARRPTTSWKLVFHDEFNGTAVDGDQWGAYTGAGHDGNGRRMPRAVTVENGKLVVTGQMVDGTLVSGGIAQRKDYLYGRMEFRVRTGPDASGATSGVVLTWPKSGRWPIDGENDIYETGTDTDRAPFQSVVHYGAADDKSEFDHAANASEWHIMAMEWDPGAIRIYRDGALAWSVTDPAAVARVPHHLCIQLDALRRSMGAPVKMYVDYVRIYQRA